MEGRPEPEVILPSPRERREVLLTEMATGAAEGRHCGCCSGVCCTYLANSMRITPLEALDLKTELESTGRWHAELMRELRDCVEKFRLDHEPGDGRRTLRRTYTCPFYRPGNRGCTISRSAKPYGCLAFNARRAGITEGGDCASAQALLKMRQTDAETACNRELQLHFGLPWETAPIPTALLALSDLYP